eukprot:CAMPEP_0180673908 /NCGR_PEP_ID=MMETSP1037_2-20121125/65944_1 /TAXON_ID=632150 /ORGANISM="Azadinium spinosum, Strain 3D9" /LENGTH=49 /DNA_ID= /DNA_START= /DNA_END= /DNA_ORIENTATION=
MEMLPQAREQVGLPGVGVRRPVEGCARLARHAAKVNLPALAHEEAHGDA